MAASKDYGFTPGKDIRELDKYMNDWFDAKFSNIWPIGAVVILMDSDGRNPLDLGYPGKKWSLIGAGQMLVCRSNTSGSPWNVPPGTSVGTDGTNHTHLIVGEEDLPAGCPALEGDERQIYADMIAANSPHVLPAESREASGGGDPLVRFLLHSDTSNWQYSDDTTGYVEAQYGKLELRPVWPVTVLDNGNVQTLSENKLRALNSGSGGDIGTNYPPSMACNIWRRDL